MEKMETGHLGTVRDPNYDPNSGLPEWQYFTDKNPLLMHDVKSQNFDPSTNPQPRSFMHQQYAAAAATVLGGTLVEDPKSKGWNIVGDVKMWAIQRGDVIENAGEAIAEPMGNDTGKTTSPRQKSFEICGLFKIEPVIEDLADKLWVAFRAAGLKV